MTELTVDQLNSKVEDLQSQLKASEDKEKTAQHEGEIQGARVAAIKTAMDQMDGDQKIDFRSSINACSDEGMKKAIKEIPEEKTKTSKSKKGRGKEEDDDSDKKAKTADDDDDDDANKNMMAREENEKLTAKVKKMEAKMALPIVEKLLKARQVSGMSDVNLQVYSAQLKGKSLDEIEVLYASEKTMIDALTSTEETPGVHIPFNASTKITKMQSVADTMSGGIS